MRYIPKLIHYCWFGNQIKPEFVNECILGWKEVLPHYQIMEWNESNFNVDLNNYVRQAYDAGMFAFVSDYVRLHSIFQYGGIYLDTDVEVLRPFDDLLKNDVVLGFEQKNFIATSTLLAKKGSIFIKDFMDSYEKRVFVRNDGSLDLTTNVQMLTDRMISIGLVRDNRRQKLTYKDKEELVVLEQKYLSPFNCINNTWCMDSSTYVIHHFKSSWSSASFRIKIKLISCVRIFLGSDVSQKLNRVLDKIL